MVFSSLMVVQILEFVFDDFAPALTMNKIVYTLIIYLKVVYYAFNFGY